MFANSSSEIIYTSTIVFILNGVIQLFSTVLGKDEISKITLTVKLVLVALTPKEFSGILV